MEIVLYLATTGAEFAKFRPTAPIGWMACHFSPYGTGLSNLPRQLPAGSLLILNDRTPISGHDPQLIAQQLADAAEVLQCGGILLDLERPGAEDVAKAAAALPYPVAVTAPYARDLDCGVFLPPCPVNQPLQAHLAPWRGRDIWLEIAPEDCCIRVTEGGSSVRETDTGFPCPHVDEDLHCRYGMDVQENHVDFHLRRDWAQLSALMEEGQRLGVQKFVGLYQQLGVFSSQAAAQDTALFQS